ncbi:hypothetical protein AX15_002055 [Amanita polypyramis BW_CC]|nr:hypothetical protein AX15_002055 [Amanita polypyramis BW_CC]
MQTQNDIYITPDFVKDHVAFIENPATAAKGVQLVTLSGLRAVLHQSDLTFRSTLHPISKHHRALINPSSRASAFSHLPPLPWPYLQTRTSRTSEISDQEPPVPYPTFTISPLTPPTRPPIVPIPTRTSVPTRPPLPPRPPVSAPASRPSSASGAATTSSSSHRLPNPFASLFGGGPPLAVNSVKSPSSANTSPATYPVPLPPDSASGNVSVQDVGQIGTGAGGSPVTIVEVPVLVIDRKIVRKELAREVNNGAVAGIAHALTSRTRARDEEVGEAENKDEEKYREKPRDGSGEDEYDIPEWVAERVNEFALGMGLYPFVHLRGGAKDSSAGGGSTGGQDQTKLRKKLEVAIAGRQSLGRQSSGRGRRRAQVAEGGEQEYVIAPWSEAPEDVSVMVQDFFIELEREVRARHEKAAERRRERERSGENEKDDEKQVEKEKDEDEENEVDKLVKRVVEAVEAVLSSLFYDRLFMQPVSDDASHDETLASRVAALNMMDLTLEHLDIDVGVAGEELDLVVKACGETLMQLEVCRAPADKAAVLVGAHKVVVDGLSKLPPIRLIPEEESRANRSKQGKPPPFPPEGAELKEIQSSVQKLADGHDGTSARGEDGSLSTSIPSIPAIVEPASGEELTTATQQDEKRARGTKKPPPPLPLSPPPLDSPAKTTKSPKQPENPNSPTSERPQPKSTPVSGDVLLPILIFSVVKSNPPHLVSHLLFTQRFRNQVVSGGGEESYCLINLMAVAEFLENVDLAALGLEGPLPSAAELTPIPIVRSPVVAAATVGAGVGVGGVGGQEEKRFGEGGLGILRGKVEQRVDAIAGSANKVLAGVMDTSFGMLKSLLPGQGQGQGPLGSPRAGSAGLDQQSHSQAALLSPGAGAGTGTGSEPWNVSKPGFGLLRRETGFSIASIAASLPISRANVSKPGEEAGQQMITVSRPASVRSSSRAGQRSEGEESGDEGGCGEDEERAIGGEEEGESGEDEEDAGRGPYLDSSVRSIRSFESMMSERAGKGRKGPNVRSGKLAGNPAGGSNVPRRSLSDRLAHMSALAGIKQGSPSPISRRSSLMPSLGPVYTNSSPPSRPTTPQDTMIPLVQVSPPVQRFLECSPDDLRVGEVAELLREYRRLVEVVRVMGGFGEGLLEEVEVGVDGDVDV